jgi:hypothetical protein
MFRAEVWSAGESFGGQYYSPYCDLNGKPVECTPITHPYSYDPYVVWKGDYNEKDYAVYSDRLYQYDHKKYNEACEKVFGNQGQVFFERQPKDVEKLLQLIYEDDTIELTAIMQGANKSSGHRYWVFFYRTEKI